MSCEAPGDPQTPEIDDSRPAQNSCIKNPGVAESAAMSVNAVEPPSWSGRYITDQSLAELFQMPVKLKKRISKKAGHTSEPSPAKSPSGASPAAKDTVCRIAIPRVGNLEAAGGDFVFRCGHRRKRAISDYHRTASCKPC